MLVIWAWFWLASPDCKSHLKSLHMLFEPYKVEWSVAYSSLCPTITLPYQYSGFTVSSTTWPFQSDLDVGVVKDRNYWLDTILHINPFMWWLSFRLDVLFFLSKSNILPFFFFLLGSFVLVFTKIMRTYQYVIISVDKFRLRWSLSK